jgi:hypothetical protein
MVCLGLSYADQDAVDHTRGVRSQGEGVDQPLAKLQPKAYIGACWSIP